MTENRTPANISVDEALQLVDRHTKTERASEVIPAQEASGRVLAEDISALRDIPQFDNSAMDGFIFLKTDLENGLCTFKLNGEVKPEDTSAAAPEPGSCKRIMTGAPVPDGTLFIIPVELTRTIDSVIEVIEIPVSNSIRKKGEGYQKGTTVLAKNRKIRPYEMGLLIESGNRECRVKKKIRIALQVTGSEVDADMNTNGPMLQSLMNSWPGVEIESHPVLPDDFELVVNRLKELTGTADIICTTGGISMGARDFILPAMEKLGGEVIFRKIQQKPGKPITVTKLSDTLFFHLPGNPISATFCAEMYVRRAVQNLNELPQTSLKAVISNGIENYRGAKTLFAPGKLFIDKNQRLSVHSEGVMKSHLLQLYKNNDVYIRLEPETSYAEGDLIEVIPFSTGIDM